MRQIQLQRVRSAGEGGIAVSDALHQVRRDVARHVRVHQLAPGAGRIDADDRPAGPVGDPDALGSVLGEIAVGRRPPSPPPRRRGSPRRCARHMGVRPWVSAGCGISRGSGSAMRRAGPRRCRLRLRPRPRARR